MVDRTGCGPRQDGDRFGDLLLGMNAHINRDLAFVLAATGLIGPDGSSRKHDYDAVEKWLYDATAP